MIRGMRKWYGVVLVLLFAPGGVPVATAREGLVEDAEALNQQVMQFYQQGRFSDAIPLAQRALAIRKKALGPAHPDTAASLSNLAELYLATGAYAQAEPLYQRALAINEKALGRDHPTTAVSLNNLAALYLYTGPTRRRSPYFSGP
jgi:tetratricopeptide (TPR) repeat protein